MRVKHKETLKAEGKDRIETSGPKGGHGGELPRFSLCFGDLRFEAGEARNPETATDAKTTTKKAPTKACSL